MKELTINEVKEVSGAGWRDGCSFGGFAWNSFVGGVAGGLGGGAAGFIYGGGPAGAGVGAVKGALGGSITMGSRYLLTCWN